MTNKYIQEFREAVEKLEEEIDLHDRLFQPLKAVGKYGPDEKRDYYSVIDFSPTDDKTVEVGEHIFDLDGHHLTSNYYPRSREKAMKMWYQKATGDEYSLDEGVKTLREASSYNTMMKNLISSGKYLKNAINAIKDDNTMIAPFKERLLKMDRDMDYMIEIMNFQK